MDEFVRFDPSAILSEAAELVYHSPCNALSQPDVAIHYPDNISFCFSISSAHVPDFGIGAQIVMLARKAAEIWIFIFNK